MGTNTLVTQVKTSEDIVARYEVVDNKLFMTMDEALVLSKEIASRIRISEVNPEAVVGIANGALLVTKVIADELGLPMVITGVRRRGSRIKDVVCRVPWLKRFFVAVYRIPIVRLPLYYTLRSLEDIETGNLPATEFKVNGFKVALIDDCIESGRSIKVTRDALLAAGATDVMVCCISWSRKADSASTYGVVPDVYLSRRVHHYPWSRNSRYWMEFEDWVKASGLSLVR
jgi:adenine/guanine phosphoribosyltransferase-like PRPP-binding protein